VTVARILCYYIVTPNAFRPHPSTVLGTTTTVVLFPSPSTPVVSAFQAPIRKNVNSPARIRVIGGNLIPFDYFQSPQSIQLKVAHHRRRWRLE
jgi:hypothetical protein